MNYSCPILMHANSLFSLVKSLIMAFLKRSMIGCDVNLTFHKKPRDHMLTPQQCKGLLPYRVIHLFLHLFAMRISIYSIEFDIKPLI